MNTLIVGIQYGDEGKGRVSAELGKDADWFVRFNGGPNAGHTVWHEGKEYKLHHLPAGAVLGKKVALDAGMVIDSGKLKKELESLNYKTKLYIHRNVHLIQPEHKTKDWDGSNVGSTKSGISYVYADKALRKGVRVRDQISFLADLNGPFLNAKENTWSIYKGLPPVEPHESAIYESAQGIMLDVDYGHYPYVTSSSVFPSSLHKIDKRVGVMKAYTTRVGDGPPYFEELDWLSRKGKEFGTTTGRKRKCYWLILDELDYALDLYKPDEIVVTKTDIMKDVYDIRVIENSEYRTIGSYDSYINFLLERFPKIKWLSDSPHGPLVPV